MLLSTEGLINRQPVTRPPGASPSGTYVGFAGAIFVIGLVIDGGWIFDALHLKVR